VTPTVLTVQTPIELDPAKQYQVIVSANGALTTPEVFQLAPVSPGTQANGAGYATAQVSGTVVTSATPAAPGDKVTIFAAGLGATDPAVAAGAVTPSDVPVKITSPVSLSLASKPVTVTFAGLQAGSVGVYQIDFVVPDDAADGNLQLDMVQDGQLANSVLLPVKKKP